MSNMSHLKRQKERQRKEKQRDKEVKKADRKREKALRPPGSPEDEIEIVHVEGGTTDEGVEAPAPPLSPAGQ